MLAMASTRALAFGLVAPAASTVGSQPNAEAGQLALLDFFEVAN